MSARLLKLHVLGRWRMLKGNCPACNGSNFRRFDCYACAAGEILPRFRWARFLECVNP